MLLWALRGREWFPFPLGPANPVRSGMGRNALPGQPSVSPELRMIDGQLRLGLAASVSITFLR